MGYNLPRLSYVQRTFYGGEIKDEPEEEDSSIVLETDVEEEEVKYPSRYVKLIRDMIETTLREESELYSQDERDLLASYSQLPYNGQYMLVRLLVRTHDKWVPSTSIRNYRSEIGDTIDEALASLCDPTSPPHREPAAEPLEPHRSKSELHAAPRKLDLQASVIDLTFDSEGEEDDPRYPATQIRADTAPASSQLSNITDFTTTNTSKLRYFCRGAHTMTLSEIFHALDIASLKTIAKENRLPPGPKQRRADIIDSLLRAASCQTLLASDITNESTDRKKTAKAKDAKNSQFAHMKQTALSFVSQKKRASPEVVKQTSSLSKERLRERGLELLGTCVKLESAVCTLFLRAHIIYFRSSEMPPKLLLPSLLVAFKKRCFPDISSTNKDSVMPSEPRSSESSKEGTPEGQSDIVFGSRPERSAMVIWRDRREFTAYVNALEIQKEVDELLGDDATTILAASGILSRVGKSEDFSSNDLIALSDKERKRLIALRIVEIMEENYPEWKRQLKKASNDSSSSPTARGAGLERFQAGHVLARILAKGAEQLAILHEYQRELEVLEDLLDQDIWRRGKKGKWYDRRALVINTHLSKGLTQRKNPEEVRRKLELMERALEGLKQGLADPWTGTVHRPSLIHRVKMLEKRMKVPPAEQTDLKQYGSDTLLEAEMVKVIGIRIQPGQCIADDAAQKPAIDPAFAKFKQADPSSSRVIQIEEVQVRKHMPSQKSVWKDEATGDRVGVEELVLRHYKAQGYKGFHSETTILTTLFSLLFFDIIFLPVPGAFETQYQTAPLDLVCNEPGLFWNARKVYVDSRLQELRGEGSNPAGDRGLADEDRGTRRALGLLEEVDNREREKKTCIVGVKWDICSKEDLREIVMCIGGPALASICQLFCEDYVARCGGGPDLIIWQLNEDRRVCKFIEVKGPGDNLRENQKVWIDALKRSKVEVLVCRVYESGKEDEQVLGQKRKRKASTPTAGKKRSKSNTPLVSEDLQGMQLITLPSSDEES